MAKISIVKYQDILDAHRFDAEYFKPEYLETENLIKKYEYYRFGEISSLFVKGIFDISAKVYADSGIPFVRISNLKNLQIDDSDIIYIPESENQKNEKTELKYGDIVLSKTAYPACSLITLERCNVSQDIIAIKINAEFEIDSKFLVVFLNTRYGISQMKRNFTGNIQMHLNLTESKQILIPKFSKNFQATISRIYDESVYTQTLSKQLYKEAEELLLEEVGLVNYKPEHLLTYETTSNKVKEAIRFDAEYFQPKYAEIINKIENYDGGFELIKNIVDWKKGIEVGSDEYSEYGKDFIRVSDFSIFGLKEKSKKISDALFENIQKDYQPKKGEILFTKDGTIGLSYLLKENIEGVISGAFLRLKLKGKYKDFEKECLTLILNSILCKMQVEQLSGGAIIAHLKPSDFEKFKIPLIKSNVQYLIANKIQESHLLIKKSKELIEEAKRKVEEEIEKK